MTNGNGRIDTKYPKMRDYRHRVCGRLLFRGILVSGCVVEVRCPKCGRVAVFDDGWNNEITNEVEETSEITLAQSE